MTTLYTQQSRQTDRQTDGWRSVLNIHSQWSREISIIILIFILILMFLSCVYRTVSGLAGLESS